MKRNVAFAVLLALVLGIASLPAGKASQSLSLDQILTKMEQTGSAFRSMESSIERTRVTVLVNDKEVFTGKAYFQRKETGTRIKFDFQKPQPQIVLISGGKLLIYTAKLKQAQEFSLGVNQDKTEFLLVGFGPANKDIRRLYKTTLVGDETVDGKKTTVIDLVPMNPKVLARFKSIRLWMDPTRWVPLQSKLTEAGNDYQIAKFTDIVMNGNIADSVFDVRLPKDVQKSNMGTINAF